MRFRPLIFLAWLFMLAGAAISQKVDLEKDRVPMTVLNGPWRFHTGDDPAWSNPIFDDSAWSLLTTDKGWSQQGYGGYGGSAWYRLKVSLPAKQEPLALYLETGYVSCQIFANGRMIDQYGAFPPTPRWLTPNQLVVPIPGDIANTGALELAIRVWQPPSYTAALAGGLSTTPRLGEPATIARWRVLQRRELFWESTAWIIELFANLIGAFSSLVMFVLRRREREYLWFGLFLFVWSIYNIVLLSWAFLPVSLTLMFMLRSAIIVLGNLIGLEFLTLLFKQKRSWPYFAAAFCVSVAAVAYFINVYQPTMLRDDILTWGIAGYNFSVAALIYRAWRSGSRDAAILLFPEAWIVIETVIQRLSAVPYFSHQAWALAFNHYINHGFTWPFPFYIPSLRGDVTNLMVLIILIVRYARSRADEERLESELEAARTVQKVLIPSEFPVIPGFHVEAVYKPASQVGGDFFQVISVGNGSALVVVGDVSGKGMPAAMTVSLLVGTFRTLAHYTRKPAEILRAMNQRMLARSAGGFTTCVVLCIDPDGSFTAANAGHLPPYLAGCELSLESGLPLGLDARTSYSESQFRLKPGEQLMLITDGVPEARNAQGELFGFENTAAIANKSAEEIAETARNFGQNDDVTVVKLTWEPALLSPSASLLFSGEPTFS